MLRTPSSAQPNQFLKFIADRINGNSGTGSRRRGRNASNLQAAAALIANYKQPTQPPQGLGTQLGRSVGKDFACAVCGKDVRSCKGTGPTYARLRKRYTAMPFIG